MGSTCRGIIEGLGLAVDCSAVDSNSTLLYDPNPLTCNSMAYSKSFSLVSDQFEPYIGSVCKGIISKVYLPDPSTINPLLAPLLPPYVLQSVTEAVVRNCAYYTLPYKPRTLL